MVLGSELAFCQECSPQGNRHKTWLVLVCLIVVFGCREDRQKCVWRLVRCWKCLLKTNSRNVAMRTPFMWTAWTSSRSWVLETWCSWMTDSSHSRSLRSSPPTWWQFITCVCVCKERERVGGVYIGIHLCVLAVSCISFCIHSYTVPFTSYYYTYAIQPVTCVGGSKQTGFLGHAYKTIFSYVSLHPLSFKLFLHLFWLLSWLLWFKMEVDLPAFSEKDKVNYADHTHFFYTTHLPVWFYG